MIRSIVVILAVASFATAARAQFAPFGAVPTILNPYPFIAPSPPANADAANAQRCAPVYSGRGGARYPCAGENSR